MNSLLPVVTLTTDFGEADSYVAEMKGVLYSAVRELSVVDVTHQVSPQDVQQGAYILGKASLRFPSDTIHVGVVDPGVGTGRRGIVVSHDRGVFVGPDNGLFSEALTDGGLRGVFEIQMDGEISRTFHGRDVFAPTAARLATGLHPADVGSPVDDPITIERWQPSVSASSVVGQVLHVDGFGNAVTNIRGDQLTNHETCVVEVSSQVVKGVRETYGQVGPGEGVALIGSQGTLEVSVNGGNAAQQWGIARGDEVRVSW